MSPQIPCPEPARLRELLQGSLAGTIEAEVATHVELCGSCQRQLDELSAEAELDPEMARRLGREQPFLEPALCQVLHALKGEDTRATQAKAIKNEDLSLDFLSPP